MSEFDNDQNIYHEFFEAVYPDIKRLVDHGERSIIVINFLLKLPDFKEKYSLVKSKSMHYRLLEEAVGALIKDKLTEDFPNFKFNSRSMWGKSFTLFVVD